MRFLIDMTRHHYEVLPDGVNFTRMTSFINTVYVES
jgi:hypothetical protein